MSTRSKSRAKGHTDPDARRRYWAAQKLLENDDYVQGRYALESCGFWLAPADLGFLHEKGMGVDQDLTRAVTYYKQGSLLGDEVAMYRLGRAYLDGRGISKNRKLAKRHFEMAAEKSYPRAIRELAKLTKNVEDRMELFAEAAEEGDKESMRIYGKWLVQNGELERGEAYIFAAKS